MPSQLRYSELLRYEQDLGVLFVYDQGLHPLDTLSLRLADAETTLAALEGTVLFDPMLRALVLGFGLVQQARSALDALDTFVDAVRARAAEPLILNLVDRMVQCANQAIAQSKPVVPALLQLLSKEIRTADRVAERCGRQANDLLLDGDQVLAYGPLAVAGNWLLHTAHKVEHKPFTLHLHTSETPQVQRYTQAYARELGLELGETIDSIRPEQFALMLLHVPYLQHDGSALVMQGTVRLVQQARQASIPCYVLAFDGPQVPLPYLTPTYELLPAQLINAIITSRGMYRPSRIGDYHNDAEPPLDVISLT